MGNICKHTVLGTTDTYVKITIENFNILKKIENGKEVDDVIGAGGFAIVKRVKRREGSETKYAMKTMSKLQVSQQKNIQPTMNEMFILRDIQHPFLIDMKWAFHDEQYLYLIMKELEGKDLRFHITHFKLKDDIWLKLKQMELEQKKLELDCIKKKQPLPIEKAKEEKKKPSEPSSFTENQARFFIAQICLALNYLHNKKIIHRDIKPENILFESDGYLRITDLGIAKVCRPNNNTDTSGTPGYMAPEVLCRQNHNYAVDYYAVGVIAYELMLNKRPYESDNDKKDYRTDVLKNILSSQIQVIPLTDPNFQTPGKQEEKIIKGVKYTLVVAPQNWSIDGIDFINLCLKRKPTERLGYEKLEEVIGHSWFKNIDFDLLCEKKYKNIPFCKIHIERSQRRNQVFKHLEDEIKKIESKKEEEIRNNLEDKNRQQQNKESQNSTNNEESVRENNVIHLYNNQQQNNPLNEEEEQNNQKLRNIQHFFKSYYFDRQRYEIELQYIEERKNLQRGKLNSHASNRQSPNNRSSRNGSVLSPYQEKRYSKEGDTQRNNDTQQDFPEIEFYPNYQNQSSQMVQQPTINQRQINRSSVINPQQVQNNIRNMSGNQSISVSTRAESNVSSRRLNDSMASKSDMNNSFLSKSKSNSENRQLELTPIMDQKSKIQNTPQININQQKPQNKNIFQTPLKSIAENNQSYQK